MADIEISDLDSIGSVDGSSDVIPIVDTSADATRKATRNQFLGISSTPLGLTDSQSPTNKTLDNSNIISVRDDRFTVQDSNDTTKRVNFQLSGITTGQTRTLTLPDRSDTLVTLAGTETLTNKTLTSPTINTPTISNPTLTVNSIAEHTAGSGVTIDGMLVKDGTVGAGSITPAALVSGTGASWEWQTWSPTYANIITSSATIVARYTQIGKTVHARWSMTHGASSDLAASHTISLPVTAASGYTNNIDIIGQGIAYDSSGVVAVPIQVAIASTTTFRFRGIDLNAVFYDLSSTIPYNWDTSDIISVNFTYEAA